MTKTEERKNAYLAFQYPEFRYFLSMRFFVTIAVQIQSVVTAWLIYELTNDPLSLGLVGLVEAIPAISVALIAGYIVDRNERRTVLSVSLALIMLSAVGFLLCCIYPEQFNYKWIYTTVFLNGLARGFFAPAAFSLLPSLVPRAVYSNSTTWNSSTWQIGAVVGPAMGGMLYAWLGAVQTMTIAISLMLVSLAFTFLIKKKGVPAFDKGEAMMNSLKKGVSFVFNQKIILGALTLDLFAVLFGGAVALLPVFAKDVLFVGPEGLGLLRACPAVGAFTMMMVLAYNPVNNKAGLKLLYSVAAFGLCMIAFALSRNYWLSAFILVLSGSFDAVSVVLRSTILQLLTPDDMRGRVSAVNTIFIGSSNEIGAFESGTMARLMRVVPSVVFGGCMTLLVVGVMYYKSPSLRRLNLSRIQ